MLGTSEGGAGFRNLMERLSAPGLRPLLCGCRELCLKPWVCVRIKLISRQSGAQIQKENLFHTLRSANSFIIFSHTYVLLSKPGVSSVTSFVLSHSRF